MTKLYVADTNAIISYFKCAFGVSSTISEKGLKIIGYALDNSPNEVRLCIPSVVFVEIYEKWFTTEEFAKKVFYEVYQPILQSPNIEIKPIEDEVLENVIKIDGKMKEHEMNDKLILASAMMLNCPLITSDTVIIDYVKTHNIIPEIIC